MEPNGNRLVGTRILFNEISRCAGFIDEIRVKDVESVEWIGHRLGSKDILHCKPTGSINSLVALYNFWWRVILIVMRLVVFVPLVTGVDTIKVSWFAWAVFILP
jgi:hypothetical protein